MHYILFWVLFILGIMMHENIHAVVALMLGYNPRFVIERTKFFFNPAVKIIEEKDARYNVVFFNDRALICIAPFPFTVIYFIALFVINDDIYFNPVSWGIACGLYACSYDLIMTVNALKYWRKIPRSIK